MRGPYDYIVLSSYPHLSEAEGKIWTRFIISHPDFFDRVWYDVNVGSFRGDEDNLKPEYQDNREYLGSYKIDVLGQRGDKMWILEIKREATSKAMGEVWLYEHCYLEDHEGLDGVQTAIVTDKEMPNIRKVCEKDNVFLFVV